MSKSFAKILKKSEQSSNFFIISRLLKKQFSCFIDVDTQDMTSNFCNTSSTLKSTSHLQEVMY